jgi:hypothetical protein
MPRSLARTNTSLGTTRFSRTCYAVASKSMSLTRVKGQLMSASEIDRTLVRLAHEILEKNTDLERLAFIGIRRRGVPAGLCKKLAAA